MSEHLACHRTVGASIVMLVASDLVGLRLPAASSSGGPWGPAFLARFITGVVPSGGWFGLPRQAD
jgi:hypothetical protein